MAEHADARTDELAARLAAVRRRLDAAVTAAGRTPGDVELMVVTKFFPADDVRRLITLGATTFGESREPEAGRKVDDVSGDGLPAGVTFDMIGSVQSKKARSVARWARAVHSVDRPKIVDALSLATRAALDSGERSDPLDVLLQVSLDGDPTRGGVLIEELPELGEHVESADALHLRGMMVIAPLDGSAERWMTAAEQIHHDLLADFPEAIELSAGMSNDLEEAVRHGSSCVRVGTAIMGDRPLVSQ